MKNDPIATVMSVAPKPTTVVPAFWDPADTVVFAAGLLRWARHDLYDSMSRAERRDQALIETLAQRGVPRERMTFLRDHEATLAAARTALRASIDAAGPD